jgi:predicted enzyme related to lactoylglutathione lyase
MDGIDDYFEYALDLPPDQRQQLLAGLRSSDPAMAAQLTRLLDELVSNPDFACHGTSLAAAAAGPARVRHVTLRVGDLGAALRWYGSVFHCRVVQQQPDRAVIAFANLELQLVLGELEPPGLSVQAADVAALGATERLPDGGRVLRLVDPWGNPFEVTS